MYVDKELKVSDGQALTATAASTDLIDLSVANIDRGKAMAMHISLDVAADDTTGDETYSVALQTDSDSGFGSAVELGTATITRGDAAGSKYVINLPSDGSSDRYLRLNYTLGGTTPTVTVTAFLAPVDAFDGNDLYANGYTIS